VKHTYEKDDVQEEYASIIGLPGVKLVGWEFSDYRGGIVVVATEKKRHCLGRVGHFSIEWTPGASNDLADRRYYGPVIGVYDAASMRALIAKHGKHYTFYVYPLEKKAA
jgi:hypothetical protein